MANTIEILLTEPIGTIHRNIYGHFIEHLGACVYGGIWSAGGMSEPVVNLLKAIAPAVVRWPGGCFADDYHWRDGIGPAESRPRRVNIHWGEVIETNAFGTHEFVRFCRAIGAEPYVCGNVGSGTPQELREWVEYCNFPGGSTLSDRRRANGQPDPFKITYWGVGNENWGCGGRFTPEDYAAEYRRFSTYLRDLGGHPLFLIACGPSGNDVQWTRRFFEKLSEPRACARIHGFAAHYYCGTAGTATDYTDEQWYELLEKACRMEAMVVQQRAVMDGFDPHRKIGLIVDEWGTWHPPTEGRNPRFLWQQNTLRDALVAALTLDIFNRHADKVVMANIAQTVNVLQALVLAEEGKAIATPTYHVFDLYKGHQGGTALRAMFHAPALSFTAGGKAMQIPSLAGSASLKGKTLTLTVVNPSIGAPIEATINLRGDTFPSQVRKTVLTHEDIHAHNTFAAPTTVKPSEPANVPLTGSTFPCTFAPQSVTRLEMELV